MDTCLICERIQQIQKGENEFFVKELETGFVVMGNTQYFKGYTLFLSKEHKKELHELPQVVRQRFLYEMSLVAEAVYRAFKPQKLNYELLGNAHEHMHWHLFPRYEDDLNPAAPIWVIDKGVRDAEDARPSVDELDRLKRALLNELDKPWC